jgi:hypothetical protein
MPVRRPLARRLRAKRRGPLRKELWSLGVSRAKYAGVLNVRMRDEKLG